MDPADLLITLLTGACFVLGVVMYLRRRRRKRLEAEGWMCPECELDLREEEDLRIDSQGLVRCPGCGERIAPPVQMR